MTDFLFRTPLGGFSSWCDAADACERADLDPQTCIEWDRTPPASTCIETIGGDPATAIRLSFQINVF